MTKETAIELVKKDMLGYNPDALSNISGFEAVSVDNEEWNVICKYKAPVQTPIGHELDSVTYLVHDDGTVLVYPE